MNPTAFDILIAALGRQEIDLARQLAAQIDHDVILPLRVEIVRLKDELADLRAGLSESSPSAVCTVCGHATSWHGQDPIPTDQPCDDCTVCVAIWLSSHERADTETTQPAGAGAG